MNDQWFKGSMLLLISRFSGLAVLRVLEKALRDPELPEDTRREVIEVGAQIAFNLIDEGLPVREPIRKRWEKTFRIALPEGPSAEKSSPLGNV